MAGGARILVTGGAGYLGSVVTEALLRRGHAVAVLDNFTFTDVGIAHLRANPRLEIFEGDIRDTADVRAALRGAEAVIHLAAIANDPSGDLDPALTRSINLDAYLGLLREARRAGARRFLNASSFSVYGRAEQRDIDETHPLRPQKEYSRCKASSEDLVRDYDEPDFVTTSLRCATICGFSRRLRLDLIANTFVSRALVCGQLEVWGGEQERPQIHIDDLCDIFLALLDAPADRIAGEVFNAGGVNASILELAQAACEVAGGGVGLELRPSRDDERSYHVSSEKLARRLGLRARRSIRDAMRGIARGYRDGLWSDPDDPLHHNVLRMTELGAGRLGRG